MRNVSVASVFQGATGYGQLGEYAVLGFKYQCDLNVTPYPLRMIEDIGDKYIWSTQLRAILREALFKPDDPMYFYSYLEDIIEVEDYKKIFPGTMYESTKIPEQWAKWLNNYPVVMVPANFLIETLKNSGVTTDISVIPDGYDPYLYRPVQRNREPLVTLIVGPVLDRKNTKKSIAAWKKVFSGRKDARLIIHKGYYDLDTYKPDDDRIIYNANVGTSKGIFRAYLGADILLAMGSEGFGMPMLEGMASSMPVIAMNSEGQADVCKEAGDCLLTVEPDKLVRHTGKQLTYGGEHWVPKVDDIADRLQWVVDNPEKAYEMGRRAEVWAPTNRSIWYKMPKVYELMEKYGAWD